MDVYLIDSLHQKERENKMDFSDKISSYEGNLFHMENLYRQTVAFLREFVPVDWFFQTRCMGC